MKLSIFSPKTILPLFAILILGFFLRSYHLYDFPRKGATFDEYAWTWLGMNILQVGVPISWSPHPQYQLRVHYIEPAGTRFWLVQPYLEHPPLFGLVAGSYAIASGAKDMFDMNIQHIRGLSLILGMVSIVLVYVLADHVFDQTTGFLAALFYAITPTIAIGSRLVQNENFFIPVFLTAVLCVFYYLKKKNSWYVTIAAMLCGLLTLAKVPWFAASAGIGLILLQKKEWKALVWFSVVVFSFFAFFFLWGIRWNHDVFFGLWKLQLARYDITFDGLLSLFTTPYLVDRLFLDGWILCGWFAIAIVMVVFPDATMITFPFLGYFAIYVFAIPNEPGHGWYRYPFYPILMIALAAVWRKALKESTILPFFFTIIIGLSLLSHTWQNAFGFSFGAYRSFLFAAAISLLPILFGMRQKKIRYIVNMLPLTILLFLSIWTVVSYTEG